MISGEADETITEANDRKIREYANCIRRGDDPQNIIRAALRDILKAITASEHRERLRRINAETEVREDDGVRRLLHRQLADAKAQLVISKSNCAALTREVSELRRTRGRSEYCGRNMCAKLEGHAGKCDV